jgi:RHS repeat-associated protein
MGDGGHEMLGLPNFLDLGYYAAGRPTSTQTCNLDTHDAVYSSFVIADADGTLHPLSSNFQYDADGCVPVPATTATIDHSGLTVVTGGSTNTWSWIVYDKFGNASTRVAANPLTYTATTPSGVTAQYSSDQNSVTTTYTDPLETTGSQAFLVLKPQITTPPNVTLDKYTYTDAGGNTQLYQVNYGSFTLITTFGCSQVSDIIARSITLPTSITMPTGSYSFSYEVPHGKSAPYTTGRIINITYPTGGSTSYAYSGTNGNGGTGGIDCKSGVVPQLTRTVNDNNGTSAKWTFLNTAVGASGIITTYPFTVTAVDPSSNYTVYTMWGEFPGSIKYYQGVNTGTPLKTETYCYWDGFGTTGNCGSTVQMPYLPFTEIDKKTALGSSASNDLKITFDSLGNVTGSYAYDYGASGPSRQVVVAYGSWSGTSCVALSGQPFSSYITGVPCDVLVKDGAGNKVKETRTSYDGYGRATDTYTWVAGSTFLHSTASFNPNGTVATSTDVNGTPTVYRYDGTGGCNDLLVTSMVAGGLTTSQKWDCNGGVLTESKDANLQPTDYAYADPYWRVTSITDPEQNVTTTSYPSLTSTETSLVFNNNASTVDVLSGTDGLGRLISTQHKTAPGSSSYDNLVQYGYGWGATIGAFRTQLRPSATTPSRYQYDGVGRLYSAVDGGGGTTSLTYPATDVLSTSGPSPNSSRQTEYDGLGRVKSICEVSAQTGSAPCGQNNAQNGFLTTYAYDSPVTNAVTITQNANGTAHQQRKDYYDGIGRLTQEVNPENGTVQYIFDTQTSTCGGYSSKGDLMEKIDNAQVHTCYGYDALHRLIGFDNTLNTTNCTGLNYDTPVSPPTGVTVANSTGRMVEAFTNSTCNGHTNIVTDEWFSYSPRGELTDVYESTPNSNGYYHTTASYFANGAVSALGGVPSHSGWTFNVDGEGRPLSAVDQTTPTTLVSHTAYNTASQPTIVNLGSGDVDTYGYDMNTGRMTSYQFAVGSTPKYETGTLTWNANGTLGALGITNQIYTADAQSCTYGYDDLARLGSTSCGATWAQTFTYDPFGNIVKSGAISFQVTYDPATNHISTIPGATAPTYDLNGNLLTITDSSSHSYSWDAYGKAIGIDTTVLTYDALGRMVEQNKSGTFTELLYSPIGKLALMVRQIPQSVFLPLPGREQATYSSQTIRYRHYDWLGNGRFESNSTQLKYGDASYAPFGETYDVSGLPYLSFTGQQQDTVSGLDDFTFREYSPTQGRWISPDPSGMSAVDFSNPQSFNRYVYALNQPTELADASGLCPTGQADSGPNGWDAASGQNGCGGIGVNAPFPGFYVWIDGVDGWSTWDGLITRGSTDGSSILPGENSTNWSLPFTIWDLLGISPPNVSNCNPICDATQDAANQLQNFNQSVRGCYNAGHDSGFGRAVEFFSPGSLTPLDNNYKKNRLETITFGSAKGGILQGVKIWGKGLFKATAEATEGVAEGVFATGVALDSLLFTGCVGRAMNDATSPSVGNRN